MQGRCEHAGGRCSAEPFESLTVFVTGRGRTPPDPCVMASACSTGFGSGAWLQSLFDEGAVLR